FFAAAVGVVILRDDLLLLAGQPFPRAIPLPQFIRRGEGIEWQFLFYWAGSHRAIMAMEGISVRAEHEGNIERLSIGERLLHPGAHAVAVIFGFNDRKGDMGFKIEDVICPPEFSPAA